MTSMFKTKILNLWVSFCLAANENPEVFLFGGGVVN